jgi:hypothetical protein
MKNRKIPVVLTSLCVFLSLAQAVDLNYAGICSNNFANSMNKVPLSFQTTLCKAIDEADTFSFFLTLYDFEDGTKGWLALNSVTTIRPVLGFSMENTIDTLMINDRSLDIVQKLAGLYYRALPNLSSFAKKRNEKNWEALLNGQLKRESDLVYGPWLETTWNQGHPYNEYCPLDPVTGDRSWAGCVMTASAQIMNYWAYPYNLRLYEEDSYYSTYTDPPIWIEAPPASMDTILWSGFEAFEPSSDTIARLQYAVGVKLLASYSSAGTGASLFSEEFIEKFGFAGATNMRRYFDAPLLESDMQNGMPMYLSLTGVTYGHAVVIDGFRTSGEYHLNMGWGGGGDGWFAILDDDLPSDFIALNTIIYGIIAPEKADIPNTKSAAMPLSLAIRPVRIHNNLFGGDRDAFSFMHPRV